MILRAEKIFSVFESIMRRISKSKAGHPMESAVPALILVERLGFVLQCNIVRAGSAADAYSGIFAISRAPLFTLFFVMPRNGTLNETGLLKNEKLANSGFLEGPLNPRRKHRTTFLARSRNRTDACLVTMARHARKARHRCSKIPTDDALGSADNSTSCERHAATRGDTARVRCHVPPAGLYPILLRARKRRWRG